MVSTGVLALVGGAPRWSGLVLVVALVSVVQLLGLKESWAYQARAIGDGAWWLLVTGHFVHLNLAHYLLNTFAWVLIWTFAFSYMTLSLWVISFLLCALGTGLGMFWFYPELAWYVGLSGVLHGVLCIVLIRMAVHNPRDWLIYLVMAGMLVKVLSEQLYGPTPGTAELVGEPVIVDAHLCGLVSGAIVGAHLLALDLYRQKSPT